MNEATERIERVQARILSAIESLRVSRVEQNITIQAPEPPPPDVDVDLVALTSNVWGKPWWEL